MPYYQGIVCDNAHQVARRVMHNATDVIKYCDQCGAKAHDTCPECNSPVRGGERPQMVRMLASDTATGATWPFPWYCYECGKAYPWTLAKIAGTEAALEELDELTPFERQGLKTSIPDLLTNTPNSDVAVLRWRKALQKVATPTRDIVVKIIAEIAAASIKKQMDL